MAISMNDEIIERIKDSPFSFKTYMGYLPRYNLCDYFYRGFRFCFRSLISWYVTILIIVSIFWFLFPFIKKQKKITLPKGKTTSVQFSSQLQRMAASPTANPDIRFHWDRPKILAYCSVTGGCQRDFNDLKNLSYLHSPSWEAISPESPLDLDLGFENYQRKAMGEKLLSTWYRNNREQLSSRIDKAENSVFVTFRGALQTVMKMPFERKEGWTMYATKYQNHIFICEVPKEQFCYSRDEYRGFKLEQCLCSGNPQETPVTTTRVHDQKEFCLIFHQKLNGKDIIYGGEIDAISRENPINAADDVLEILNNDTETNIIEIKSAPEKVLKELDSGRSLRWFVQSFLSGIEKIYVAGKGIKDGKVRTKEILETKKLPLNRAWSEAICLQSLDRFFCLLETTLKEKKDFTKIKVEWKPGFENPYCVEMPWKPELMENVDIFDVLDLFFKRPTSEPAPNLNAPRSMSIRPEQSNRSSTRAYKQTSGRGHPYHRSKGGNFGGRTRAT